MARLRPRRPFDFWPGFVDAATSLVMALTFVLLVFAVGQLALTFALGERDSAIRDLQARLADLAQRLGLAQKQASVQEETLAQLRATLARTQEERDAAQRRANELSAKLDVLRGERDAAEVLYREAVTARDAAKQTVAQLNERLAFVERERDETAQQLQEATAARDAASREVRRLEQLIAELNAQLEALNRALAAAEAKATEQDRRIADLEKELNLALVVRIRELERQRSVLFARLMEALKDNPNVRIDGERFLFADDVLFPSGSAELTVEGLARVQTIAEVVRSLLPQLPADIPWVLQVEGHTDRRPIRTAQYPSNWELSTARAMAVVRVLREAGIPPQRLAATGYGEFHPIDARDTPEAWARNRRIELRLTWR